MKKSELKALILECKQELAEEQKGFEPTSILELINEIVEFDCKTSSSASARSMLFSFRLKPMLEEVLEHMKENG
jgi:hypothetical protein